MLPWLPPLAAFKLPGTLAPTAALSACASAEVAALTLLLEPAAFPKADGLTYAVYPARAPPAFCPELIPNYPCEAAYLLFIIYW